MKHIVLARRALACGLLLLTLAVPGRALARQAADLRLFLRDGTAVAIFGDFARVGDRVVFTMAVSAAAGAERLQTVTLPAALVDWPRTEEYGAAMRAAHYARTQGEADYAQLTASVARALSQVADRKNPFERLQLVEQTRGIVATWSRDHYGYRSGDLRQIEAMLDELVSEFRAEAGITQFDLNLLAPGVEPPVVQPLAAPTLVESIEQVLRVAKASDVPADRTALLRAAVRMLDEAAGKVPSAWASSRRAAATGGIVEEARTDREYRDLAEHVMERSWSAARHADSEGVERALADAARRDERLGRKRPDEMSALVSTLQAHLDAARRLRLARDHWQTTLRSARSYERELRRPMRDLARAARPLDAIKRLSGPDPDTLATLRERLGEASRAIEVLVPPEPLAGIHATFVSACLLATRAAEMRERAIASGDLQVAWDASAAAAGATLLLSQARQQLQAALRAPELQ